MGDDHLPRRAPEHRRLALRGRRRRWRRPLAPALARHAAGYRRGDDPAADPAARHDPDGRVRADPAPAPGGRAGRRRDPGHLRLLQRHRRRAVGHHRSRRAGQGHRRDDPGGGGEQGGAPAGPGRGLPLIERVEPDGAGAVTVERVEQQAARPPWMEQASLVEGIGKAVVLTLIAILVIYPFVTVVATSLGTEPEITRNGGLILLWPTDPTLNAYKTIFTGGIVTRAVMV